jgi:hypothetical protein
MKVLCSQEVVSPHLCGVIPCQVTAQVSAPQASRAAPWFLALQGISGGRVGSKAIDYYAFSWGVPRKPACNVVETAQRKSQPQTALERSVAFIRTQQVHDYRRCGRKMRFRSFASATSCNVYCIKLSPCYNLYFMVVLSQHPMKLQDISCGS